ncbi:MAG: 3-phosphoshikimate 1-carboxyvinyltransferase [Acidimicrobiaceae bacterium]|nr:3-phosphoshikimate 1-carboxyvinyltransferase [Acidimicrobiaceae bacterium]
MTDARLALAELAVEPLAGPPHTVVRVPGSKSLTNRALVCALLASGRSVLTGALDADDTRAMAEAVAQLGAAVAWEGTTITVDGTGGELTPGPLTLHVRDSGTCARFLAPVLALGRGRYVLDGSEQLRRRPMRPMVEALRSLGVEVQGDSLPLTILGTGSLPPSEVAVPGGVSSQFISGLLLAGARVRAEGDIVSRPYIEMTEHVRAAFAGQGTDFAIEPDATAASYFYAAAAMFDGGSVAVEGLGPDSVQGDIAFVDRLVEMGARLDGQNALVGTGTFRGITVDLRDTPDVAQTLAAAAVFADGPTTITGIGFVRGHETDRIKAVVTELRRLGLQADEADDGFTVHPAPPRPALVETYGDHRMAMAFALIGLKTPGIRIKDPGCVAKTFPEFWSVLDGLRR